MLQLFSHQVMSHSLRPHGLQHARLPCPSPSPGVGSNSCPLSRWCHPTISSATPFSSCPQSLSASGSFSVSWLFLSDGQSIGASASVLPMRIQRLFPLGLRNVCRPCQKYPEGKNQPSLRTTNINNLVAYTFQGNYILSHDLAILYWSSCCHM